MPSRNATKTLHSLPNLVELDLELWHPNAVTYLVGAPSLQKLKTVPMCFRGKLTCKQVILSAATEDIHTLVDLTVPVFGPLLSVLVLPLNLSLPPGALSLIITVRFDFLTRVA